MPTQRRDGSPDGTGFSVEAALRHVEVIAREPHPIGSPEHTEVRGYLVETLRSQGFDPVAQTTDAPDFFGVPGGTVEVTNVLARVDGYDSTGALILVAHYDTVPSTPGANDDSSSIGVLLVIAESLQAESPLRNDVILFFSDGEEPAPRLGSPAFVSSHPWFRDVAFVVNLEANGSGGPSLLIETSGSERWGIDLLAEAAPYPAAFSFVTEISDLIGGFGTDFDPFKERGVPGLSFAYTHGSPVYHTADDAIGNVSRASVERQGANTLALVRLLGGFDFASQPNQGGAVFFTVAGSHIVRYSDALAVFVAIVGLVGFGLTLAFHRRRATAELRGVASNAALVVVTFLGALVGGAALWTLVAGVRDMPGVLESYLYLILLLALASAAWLWAAHRRHGSDRTSNVLGGVVAVLVLFALLASAFAPGTSYLFAWPAWAGLVYWAAWPALLRSSIRQAGALLVLTLVVLAVNVPAIDIFFQMAQPRPGNPDSNLMPVAGLAAGLWVLVIAVLHPAMRAWFDRGSLITGSLGIPSRDRTLMRR